MKFSQISEISMKFFSEISFSKYFFHCFLSCKNIKRSGCILLKQRITELFKILSEIENSKIEKIIETIKLEIEDTITKPACMMMTAITVALKYIHS